MLFNRSVRLLTDLAERIRLELASQESRWERLGGDCAVIRENKCGQASYFCPMRVPGATKESRLFPPRKGCE
jgi:hypothetical protein